MLRLTHWILCGALALPIGFALGYALDAKLPEAKAKSYETPLSALPPAPLRVAEKPVVPEKERATPPPAPREKIVTKEPERVPPPAATPPPAPEKPAPVTANPPAKKSIAGLPRLDFDKSSIALDGDEVKIRTPYGSFSLGF